MLLKSVTKKKIYSIKKKHTILISRGVSSKNEMPI